MSVPKILRQFPFQFFFIIFFIVLSVQGYAQRSWRIRVDELKQQLPTLPDTTRIDVMGRIASLYFAGLDPEWDSSKVYAWKAITESRRINDKRREARSFLNYAQAYIMGGNDPYTAEKHYKTALRIGLELKNEFLMQKGYYGSARAVYFQSKFQNALDTFKIATEIAKKNKDTFGIIESVSEMSGLYVDIGDYEKALEIKRDVISIARAIGDSGLMVNTLLGIGLIYYGIGDHEGTKRYLDESFAFLERRNQGWERRHYYVRLSNYYISIGNFDSALYYNRVNLAMNPVGKLTLQSMGELYLQKGDYDSSLFYFNKMQSVLSKYGEGNLSMALMLNYSKLWLAKKDHKKSMSYATRVLANARQSGARQYIRDALQLLATIHKELNKPEEALSYYQQYIVLKDSLSNDQLKGKLYDFKRVAEDESKLAQIELLKKEKDITDKQLKWQQQRAKENSQLRNILIIGIILISLLSIFIFRSFSLKRKNERLLNEKIQNELQHKAIDLEMQALRAQMNPHFIFNCLSSINRFILKNETEIASDYLTRFSRLIRLVLIHSQLPVILLRDEIEMLRLYLDMEQLRFKNTFDYEIIYSNSIDPEVIFIPPLLLQPFCENAIWHGLMNKQGEGHLEIKLSVQDNILTCLIADNGVGRAKAAEFKSKSGERQKSFGLKITSERLALINKEKGVNTNYEIEDILNENGDIAGTKVTLRIGLSGNAKEPVKELSRTI